MVKFFKIEEERINFMKAIALEISVNEKSAILKGGTSLLLTRGLDRFSEDMDFDLPLGTVTDFQKHILKAAENVGIKVDYINIKKNTETTKRYLVHYQSVFTEQSDPLKIECSMRREIDNEDVELVQGIRTYTVARITELKAEAFTNRDRARDTYDIAFLTGNYSSEIKPETWERIEKSIEKKGIDWLSESFDDERDKLLSDFDGTEIVFNILENLNQYKKALECCYKKSKKMKA